jgi:hypothetical protein
LQIRGSPKAAKRQALALMEHPNIAKVFDAGATPQGRPYFVMEYVTGIAITQYCDKRRMTLRERLELFVHARVRAIAAAEPEDIGGRVESHQRSHQETLGGLPEGPRNGGISSRWLPGAIHT